MVRKTGCQLDMMEGVNGLVSAHTSWCCVSPDSHLADIVSAVLMDDGEELTHSQDGTSGKNAVVYLEQNEDLSPCVLTLRCDPSCPALISCLLIVSEARTMEVYSGTGEYCGTCRGEREPTQHINSDGDLRLYSKYLKLESSAPSCEVKLLSLDGREKVGIARVMMGLCADSEGPVGAPGMGIDLQCVQSMMDSMGTTLSPGARSLMDMVQSQQKNQTDILSGFLPLLMGGGALVKSAPPQPATGHTVSSQPAETSQSSCPQYPAPAASSPSLAGMMSTLLTGQTKGNSSVISPDLLPALQSVCGQVARMRVEEARCEASTGKPLTHSCCTLLEEVLVRRMEEMELRLRQHVDQRLDALQERLEHVLLAALPGVRGLVTNSCGEGLTNGES